MEPKFLFLGSVFNSSETWLAFFLFYSFVSLTFELLFGMLFVRKLRERERENEKVCV